MRPTTSKTGVPAGGSTLLLLLAEGTEIMVMVPFHHCFACAELWRRDSLLIRSHSGVLRNGPVYMSFAEVPACRTYAPGSGITASMGTVDLQ